MNKKALLAQVEKNVLSCKECRLYKTAHNPVPGEGNINSEIVFIGEAPGAQEDKTGRPFVGKAGKLLEGLLSDIGYKREDVWIGNIIKHRPPGNRDPLTDEITACQVYLKLQLEAIDPKIIITLGRFAMNYFYKEGRIGMDRGTLKKVDNYYIYPVYHPAAALRNPGFAEKLREDFVKIPEMLEFVKKSDEEEINSEKTQDLNNPQTELFK